MKFKRCFPVTVLIGLAVFAIAFTATVASAKSPQPQASPPPPEQVQLVDEDFEGWRYTAYREGKDVTLWITLEDTSPAGLEAFRAANRQMAHDLAKQQRSLDVTVVLNQPLLVDEFTELVDKYGLQVYGFQMRVIDGHGDRVTLFSSPDSDQLVPEYSLASMLGWVQDQTGEAKFLGVTTIDAGLSSSNFDILSADPAVFLVDVTPGFAEHHMRQQHASLLEAGDFVTTSAYPVYWYLESNQQSQP